eukprot:2325966-Rhodomonas_salina.1
MMHRGAGVSSRASSLEADSAPTLSPRRPELTRPLAGSATHAASGALAWRPAPLRLEQHHDHDDDDLPPDETAVCPEAVRLDSAKSNLNTRNRNLRTICTRNAHCGHPVRQLLSAPWLVTRTWPLAQPWACVPSLRREHPDWNIRQHPDSEWKLGVLRIEFQ